LDDDASGADSTLTTQGDGGFAVIGHLALADPDVSGR
jgi:hypothetical protein